MIKKLCLLLVVMLSFCMFVACGGSSATESSRDNSENTESAGSSGGASDGEIDQTKKGTVDMLVSNFWQSDAMYDETVILVAETDAAGNVISAPRAKLLFAPTNVLSVKQYFHQDNVGEKTFEQNKDYIIDGNEIVAVGEIKNNVISELDEFIGTVPYVTDRQMTGASPFPNLGLSTSIPSTDEGLYLPFTEGFQIVQMQLSVSYKHGENEWTGHTPTYYGDTVLKNTLTKLEKDEEVELFVYGDSISTGANSSGILNINPYLESWPELVKDNLSRYYAAKVNLTNKSVGGFVSGQGVAGGSGWRNGKQVSQPGLATILREELSDYSPDIAFIGFGMNDASLGVDTSTYCNNIASMINTIRARNPECDIILIGTMLANPKARDQSKNQAELSGYLTNVANLYEGVAVVDIGPMHRDILERGKTFTEISSNNVNHPNDFMARVYAMNLLSALIRQ